MLILIREDDVKSILKMEDCIKVVEDAYRTMGLGEAVLTPRENLWIKPPVSIKTSSAALTSWGFMGVHVYPGGYGKKGSGPMTVLLYDSRDGRLLSVIEARFLSWYRTGATSAVATKYLASKDADSVGIFGTGRQARTQLLALQKVLELKRVKAYSPTLEHREKFASEMSKEMGVEVKPVEDAKSCLKDVDVIVTATTTKEPVFKGEWLKQNEGCHINAIGAHYPDIREVDSGTVKMSKVVVDSREQALKEKGEILIPISEGLVSPQIIYAELGEIVAGRVRGRVEELEKTLFCSGGLAMEEIAVAAKVYEIAASRGIGTQL